MKNAILLTPFVLIPLLIFGVNSSVAIDYFSPRTASLGGAGSAGVSGTDAIYLNPSITSFQKTYSGSTSFNKYTGRAETEPKGRVFNASILDGTNEFLQAGVGYTRRADATLLHLGAAKALTDWLGFGIGVKRFYNHPGYETSTQYSASTFFDLASFLKISMMADNLKEDAKSKTWNLYRQYTAGVKVSLQNILMIYYDPSYSPHRPERKSGYSIGGELMVFEGVYFRYGLNKGVTQAHLAKVGNGMGYGLGIVFPKLTLDATYYRSMTPLYSESKMGSMTISF